MHSDPVADMLTRIRNGCRARHQVVKVPFSKLKLEVAGILKQEGYINGFQEVGQGKFAGHQLELTMRYDEKKVPVICQVKRMSSPGLRRYFDCESIPKVRGGLGIIILTTSKGLMTDRQARKARVGGEALCAVW
ncbi:MAG: 30S ribosomal protein S8 [Oxalobacteraceae bacterium]|nr:MAG: 30S ribosomal protein S8 [Oxalobacteraceae bacterium]